MLSCLGQLVRQRQLCHRVWQRHASLVASQSPSLSSSMSNNPQDIHIVRLHQLDILTQLHLEEALFRGTTSNWLVINDGVAHPSIVLGISGKPDVMVHVEHAKKEGIPLIKRFSGGGTVVVDKDTVMMSIIMNGKEALPHVERFPKQIMEWCESFLSKHMKDTLGGEFRLREHDFVVGDKKIGGNAQAISGNRWLHHTSFLFDYQDRAMALLKHPPKTPEYRNHRNHAEFVTRIRQLCDDRERFVRGIIQSVRTAGFRPVPLSSNDAIHTVLHAYKKRPNALLGSSTVTLP